MVNNANNKNMVERKEKVEISLLLIKFLFLTTIIIVVIVGVQNKFFLWKFEFFIFFPLLLLLFSIGAMVIRIKNKEINKALSACGIGLGLVLIGIFSKVGNNIVKPFCFNALFPAIAMCLGIHFCLRVNLRRHWYLALIIFGGFSTIRLGYLIRFPNFFISGLICGVCLIAFGVILSLILRGKERNEGY